MREGVVELAKLFRERDNPKLDTVGIGKVLSPLPDLRIQYGEHIILESEDLIVSASLTEGYSGEYNGASISVTMELMVGDSVILIPTVDMQKFYVMDKVGG